MEIVTRNVCFALPLGLDYLMQNGLEEPSRAGPVCVAPHPVTTVYHKPWERVLFSPLRDANPFFHLAEAMWMLAGRNDVDFINKFVHDFGLRYSDNGIMHGSYGYRWKYHWHMDQMVRIAARLKKNPKDRQVVLSMWDPAADLIAVDDVSPKDVPCNTHAYFRIRDGQLDMTVCCRSNDIIWGAYGANAVHFSFLQEYMAARIGVAVGIYYQVSNNFHAYVAEIEKLKTKATRDLYFALFDDRYLADKIPTTPLVDDPSTFDDELEIMLMCARPHPAIKNKFISDTVAPMLAAHKRFKKGQPVEDELSRIGAEDWRIACTEWINRRQQSREIPAVADKSSATIHGHI